ncbi:MAG: peptidase M48, partial [Pseudomonadota bacterium]
MRRMLLLIGWILAACDSVPPTASGGVPQPTQGTAMDPATAGQSFVEVSRAIRPIAVQECRRRTQGAN